MMDDPLMHQQMEYVAMLQVKIRHLRNQLSSLQILIQAEVDTCHAIRLGHRIKLKVRYSDGGRDEYFATIGSTLDQQFLGTDRTYFAGTNELLLSDETPIVQYLLGRTANERSTYEPPDGTNKVHIISIETSPLLSAGVV
jgi:transcription elongation GreA/GreB family factor